jgi:DNA polymerase-3 subunit chi
VVAEALFYHLTRSGLAEALALLIPRAVAAGWPVLVRGPDPARIEALDRALWLSGPEDAFVPHGLAGGPHDAVQPALLAADPPGTPPANGALCLMCTEAAAVDPADARIFRRICILFDGNDPEALQNARAQWKALTAAGIPAQYWSEASGRWQKQAEHPTPAR